MPNKPPDARPGSHSPLRGRPVLPLRVKGTGGVAKAAFIERHGVHVCCAIMVSVGLLGGLLLEGAAMPEPWNSLADVAGWSYFAAWSLSFYPQLYMNWKRKSVVGFSFDFALTNVLGFACLAIYYCSFYFDKNVREQYRASHNGADNAVRVNDVFFALHALLLTCLTLAQVGIYDRGSQRVSTLCGWAVGGAMALIVAYAGLLAAFPRAFDALTFLYLLSYIKVMVTASKYIPQALLNYQRKSTAGFNIGQMLLDLTGGVLSLFQLALEAAVLKDISLITGDPVKLCLGLLSVVYDCLLIYQHFVLYPPSKKRALEPSQQDTDALLGNGVLARV